MELSEGVEIRDGYSDGATQVRMVVDPCVSDLVGWWCRWPLLVGLPVWTNVGPRGEESACLFSLRHFARLFWNQTCWRWERFCSDARGIVGL